MTTNLLIFRPIRIQPSATSGSSSGHRKPISIPCRHGWPQWRLDPPDYIGDNVEPDSYSTKKVTESQLSAGCLTEEKAKQLRIMTTRYNT
ncbi:hypothetical protein Csa_019215 [Cucumis sativus]|uniref:Uncharacterized protein n=1 Tax=Cucumis sativus TaxID=3659 RepID=A0A0A0LI01_CUCSA|nr:hypothetical protein Csa_019215 [Cucumis sativus]